MKKARRLLLPGSAAHRCRIKDSFQSSEAGLFTSNNANKTEVCSNLFAETCETKKRAGIQTGRQHGRCAQCWLLSPFSSSSLTSSVVLPRHFQSLHTYAVRKKAMMLGDLLTALLQESELAKNLDASENHPTVRWK